jgi:hypothetical protein
VKKGGCEQPQLLVPSDSSSTCGVHLMVPRTNFLVHKQNLFCMCLFGGSLRGEDRECPPLAAHDHSRQTASAPDPFWEGHRPLPTASQWSSKLEAELRGMPNKCQSTVLCHIHERPRLPPPLASSPPAASTKQRLAAAARASPFARGSSHMNTSPDSKKPPCVSPR